MNFGKSDVIAEFSGIAGSVGLFGIMQVCERTYLRVCGVGAGGVGQLQKRWKSSS